MKVDDVKNFVEKYFKIAQEKNKNKLNGELYFDIDEENTNKLIFNFWSILFFNPKITFKIVDNDISFMELNNGSQLFDNEDFNPIRNVDNINEIVLKKEFDIFLSEIIDYGKKVDKVCNKIYKVLGQCYNSGVSGSTIANILEGEIDEYSNIDF